ncbi:MAG: hypothetical protein Q9187_009080 [Circinaria calcarea]
MERLPNRRSIFRTTRVGASLGYFSRGVSPIAKNSNLTLFASGSPITAQPLKMGQGSSKPAPASTQHVFTSETPVRFSQELVDALQASPETDSTRSKDLELHIQTRVTAELSRLEAEQSRILKELEEQISATPDGTTESSNPDSQLNVPDQSSALGGKDHRAKAEGDHLRDLGRQTVQREIEELRRRLSQRKLREDIMTDKGVEKAKEDVVRCLRINDRRPLDCWQEVDTFKKEVGRLEKDFLGRIIQ